MKFLIMALLGLGSFLIIPLVMMYGYKWRIIESTIRGSYGLPNFRGAGDSDDILTQGFKSIAASIIYEIIPQNIVLLALMLSGNSDLNSNSAIISVCIGFVINIVFVLSLVNMVDENRFGAVFDFKRVFGLIKKMGWVRYVPFLIVYTVIIEVLLLIATELIHYVKDLGSFIGSLSIFIIFMLYYAYLLMFSSRFSGLVYLTAMEEQGIEETTNTG